MRKVGEYVVYRKEVCEIIEIKEKVFNNKDYYVLVPINDKSLKLQVPTDTDNDYLRDLISLSELHQIITMIPKIEVNNVNDKLIENEYKRLMNNGSFEDLIKIIKTTYLRNRNRLENNRKISDKDQQYFQKAEKYLYTEFSIVLNKTYEETKEYIISRVERENN